MKYKKIQEYAEKLGDLYNRSADLIEIAYRSLLQNNNNQGVMDELLFRSKSMRECAVLCNNLKFIENKLNRYPPGRRPGLGYIRGFGELQYDFCDEADYDEVMKAVVAIEDYYNAMGWDEYKEYAENRLKEKITKEERVELKHNVKAINHLYEGLTYDYEHRSNRINVFKL